MPSELIDALIDQGARDLTIVNNNAGNGETGSRRCSKARRVRKIICSFPRQVDSHVFDALYRAGEIELELGAAGQPRRAHPRRRAPASARFFTPTGYGTAARRRARRRATIDGRTYVLEYSDPRRLRADQGRARRPLGQPGLPQDRAQLRPDHGDGGEAARSRRCTRSCRSGELDPEVDRHAGHLRAARRRGRPRTHGARAAAGCKHARRRSMNTLHPRADGRARRARHSRKARTSTSASACRRWSPTTCRRIARSSCTARTACSAWARRRAEATRTPT